MPVTGLIFFPPLAGNVSMRTKLVGHLSHRYPECEHRDFSLSYRLFSDTSSQLPGSDVSQRGFTHVFVSSHDPERGYVRSTQSAAPDGSQSITIAAESIDSFASLILTKLQPLWYPRQYLTLEDGVSVSLRDDEWLVSVGDIKTVSKASNSGVLRGTVVELHHTKSTLDEQEDMKIRQKVFQQVLRKIFQVPGDIFGESKFTLGETLSRSTSGPDTADWELVYIYMKTLQGQR